MNASNESVLYLSRADVEALALPMADIVASVEEAFREKGHGRTEMPPKPGIHTAPDAFIHAMPAYIPSLKAAGMKWVSGYPGNQAKGLPYITGLLVLNDPETGIPTCVMDCTWITAKRTGAATAVAAKHLARKDSTNVGILACGVQGRSNLEALCCEFPITKVKAYDIHGEIARRYAVEMGEEMGVEIEPVRTPKDAVVGMDIVVTCGPILRNPAPAIEAGWLAEGAFASPVDFDSYWQSGALEEADKLGTDDTAQMGYYRRSGYFKSTPEPYADLGQIVTGQAPGRESDSERTICINLGIALEDMAAAVRVFERAKERGAGLRLPL